ncbi:EamA family transporter [Tistrella sp. BH-R2-4]|uniref:EamA family transporter n=1 Tax=Tistrella arctica TaxID=3133430 RepID=A0ABU9YJI4_9PROT
MNAFLFMFTALLWGGGALATAFQAGPVPALVSVGYRMVTAGLLMMLWARWRGVTLTVPRADRPWVLVQGVLFFGLAFIAFYNAVRLIPSGPAALVLSTSSVFAALFGRLVLGTRLTIRHGLGLGLGILGVAVVFSGDILALIAGDRLAGSRGGTTGDATAVVAGLAWAALAAIAAGFGTVIGARNQSRGLAMETVITWGGLIGGATAFAAAILSGQPIRFDPSPRYVASLAYLAVPASCVNFLVYFSLVRRIGPGRAAYAMALVPLVALSLSWGFEGLVLTPVILAGAAIILAGNVLVLRR